MESIGEFLRHSRESQGLSLEQVALLTRIQQPFIEALENENFGSLPERVFTKGFVRTYARSLGIDEEDAVQRFSESSHVFYEKSEEKKRQIRQRIEENRKGKLNRNVVLVLTGAVLIGLVFFILPREQFSLPEPARDERNGALSPSPESGQDLFSSDDSSLSEEPFAPKDEKPVSSSDGDAIPIIPAGSGVNSIASGSEENTGTASPSAKRPLPRDVPKPVTLGNEALVLELEATEITWIVVRSDDGAPHEALLQPGEIVRWKAAERFGLTLGNAGGVNVRLNGEPRGPFGKQGVVVRDLEITP